jgi:hypothetical protein
MVYLLCNGSSFDVSTSTLSNTASVDWYYNGSKVAATATGSYTFTINGDAEAAVVRAVAISSAGCEVGNSNTLLVTRRTVDFSAIVVNTAAPRTAMAMPM